VLKIGAIMCAGKIEQERTLAVDAPEEEGVPLADFVEATLVQLHSQRHAAHKPLHDLALGISLHSKSHRRIATFRALTDLVPGDEALSHSAGEFFHLLLRTIVASIAEDQLSGVTTAAFWEHFGRDNTISVPALFLDLAADQLASDVRAAQTDVSQLSLNSSVSSKRQLAGSKRLWMAVLALECVIKSLDALPDVLQEAEQGRFAYERAHGAARPLVEVGATMSKGLGGDRVDLDHFLAHALDEWLQAEADKQANIMSAAHSWATSLSVQTGRRLIAFDQFSRMLRFANPVSVTHREIARLFALTVQHDSLDTDALGWALLASGLQLLPRPDDHHLVVESMARHTEILATQQARLLRVAVGVVASLAYGSELPPSATEARARRDKDVDAKIDAAVEAELASIESQRVSAQEAAAAEEGEDDDDDDDEYDDDDDAPPRCRSSARRSFGRSMAMSTLHEAPEHADFGGGDGDGGGASVSVGAPALSRLSSSDEEVAAAIRMQAVHRGSHVRNLGRSRRSRERELASGEESLAPVKASDSLDAMLNEPSTPQRRSARS